MKQYLLNCRIFWMFLLWLASCSPDRTAITTGFRRFTETDSNRLRTTSNEYAKQKPLQVSFDLYYPSENPDQRATMTFGEIMEYVRPPATPAPVDRNCKNSVHQRLNTLSGLGEEEMHSLLSRPTAVIQSLALPQSKTPLIIYAAGATGGSWENVVLFDSLCRKGYLVAVVHMPGNQEDTADKPDALAQQVRDIMFVKKKLKELPFVDGSRIGLMGWHQGSLAAAKAAMLSNDFKCLLSLAGMENHAYGQDPKADQDFERSIHEVPFIPERVDIPYLYLGAEQQQPADSTYYFADHIPSGQKFHLTIRESTLVSFSTLNPLGALYWPKRAGFFPDHGNIIQTLTTGFFAYYLNKKQPNSFIQILGTLDNRLQQWITPRSRMLETDHSSGP